MKKPRLKANLIKEISSLCYLNGNQAFEFQLDKMDFKTLNIIQIKLSFLKTLSSEEYQELSKLFRVDKSVKTKTGIK